jgi:hypothetical protein
MPDTIIAVTDPKTGKEHEIVVPDEWLTSKGAKPEHEAKIRKAANETFTRSYAKEGTLPEEDTGKKLASQIMPSSSATIPRSATTLFKPDLGQIGYDDPRMAKGGDQSLSDFASFYSTQHPYQHAANMGFKALDAAATLAAPVAIAKAPLTALQMAATGYGLGKGGEYLTRKAGGGPEAQELGGHIGNWFGFGVGQSPKLKGGVAGAVGAVPEAIDRSVNTAILAKLFGFSPQVQAGIDIAKAAPPVVRGFFRGGAEKPWVDPKLKALFGFDPTEPQLGKSQPSIPDTSNQLGSGRGTIQQPGASQTALPPPSRMIGAASGGSETALTKPIVIDASNFRSMQPASNFEANRPQGFTMPGSGAAAPDLAQIAGTAPQPEFTMPERGVVGHERVPYAPLQEEQIFERSAPAPSKVTPKAKTRLKSKVKLKTTESEPAPAKIEPEPTDEEKKFAKPIEEVSDERVRQGPLLGDKGAITVKPESEVVPKTKTYLELKQEQAAKMKAAREGSEAERNPPKAKPVQPPLKKTEPEKTAEPEKTTGSYDPATGKHIVTPTHIQDHANNTGISYEDAAKAFDPSEFVIKDKEGMKRALFARGVEHGMKRPDIKDSAAAYFNKKSLSELTDKQIHEYWEKLGQAPAK